jgi:hypothetical protein
MTFAHAYDDEDAGVVLLSDIRDIFNRASADRRNRGLAKDFEATTDSARAFLYAASVMLLVRRIARAS